MKTIHVEIPMVLPASYPVLVGQGLLNSMATWLPENATTLVLITDHVVKKLYAVALEKTLRQAGYRTLLLSFPAGETSKNLRTKSRLEAKMFADGVGRDACILAIGGGVVGDLAGFIAATYMRGIPYLQIPTTLLAMLDSSVGGKTGINTAQGKNLVGAFWQPQAVIADMQCLDTLPTKHKINGLIEALKVFLTNDVDALYEVQKKLDQVLAGDAATLIHLVHRAVSIKAQIVQSDEREQHQRMVLNFGHTMGHALEKITNYHLLHGYAVALGMLVEAKIAQIMGFLDETSFLFIQALLERLQIKACEWKHLHVDEMLQYTYLDKKNRAGTVYYVLLNALGSVYHVDQQYAHPVSDEVVRRAFFDIFQG